MTVAELIQQLQALDPNLPVKVYEPEYDDFDDIASVEIANGPIKSGEVWLNSAYAVSLAN